MEVLRPQLDDFYSFKRSKSGNNFHYEFETIFDVDYEVIFKASPYIFGEDKPYAGLLFEFSVLAKFAGPQSYVKDDLISDTIVAIFLDFYQSHDENISFYICDSSDGKQHVRKRKFDMWFNQYNRGAFVKIDSSIIDVDHTQYPVAFIMRANNKYKDDLTKAFLLLVAGYNEGK